MMGQHDVYQDLAGGFSCHRCTLWAQVQVDVRLVELPAGMKSGIGGMPMLDMTKQLVAVHFQLWGDHKREDCDRCFDLWLNDRLLQVRVRMMLLELEQEAG